MIRATEEAESRGKFQVILGQTSYYPKVLSGALVERLHLGFYSYNPILQFLIKNTFCKIFSPTPVMPNVYSKQFLPKIISAYEKRRVNILN